MRHLIAILVLALLTACASNSPIVNKVPNTGYHTAIVYK